VLDDFIQRFGNVPIYGPQARERREQLAANPCIGAAPAFTTAGCAPLTAQQERGLKRRDTFRECADCPEMVAVPAGSFTMGSPAWEKGRYDYEGLRSAARRNHQQTVCGWQVSRDPRPVRGVCE
jgi:formylglycine-generating enzyme required for sulfatase activity